MSTYFSPTLLWFTARRYSQVLLTVLGVLTVLLLFGDGLELLRQLGDTPLGEVSRLQLLLLRLPTLLERSLPFAVLLATLIAFYQLTRTHELTALRCAGQSIWQFMLGPALVCLTLGGLYITVLSPIAAVTYHRYQNLMSVVAPDQAAGSITASGAIWLKERTPHGETLIFAQRLVPQTTTLLDVTLFELAPTGLPRERYHAAQMTLYPGYWSFSQMTSYPRGSAPQHLGQQQRPTNLTPVTLQRRLSTPETVPVWALPGLIEQLQRTGFNVTAHQLRLQQILAMPALLLALLLLALPFALRLQRFGGVGVLLLAGLGLGFGFYLFNNVIAALGLTGQLPALAAAWLPLVVAGLCGLSAVLWQGED